MAAEVYASEICIVRGYLEMLECAAADAGRLLRHLVTLLLAFCPGMYLFSGDI